MSGFVGGETLLFLVRLFVSEEVIHGGFRDVAGAGVDSAEVVIGFDPFSDANMGFEFAVKLFPFIEYVRF